MASARITSLPSLFDSKDGGCTLFRNVGELRQSSTASHPAEGTLHSHRCENFRSKIYIFTFFIFPVPFPAVSIFHLSIYRSLASYFLELIISVLFLFFFLLSHNLHSFVFHFSGYVTFHFHLYFFILIFYFLRTFIFSLSAYFFHFFLSC